MSASIKTKTPLVSVITCTHRRPAFLRKAIDLFLAQTWPNKEMVIMNDGDFADVPKVDGVTVRHVWTSGYEGMTRKQRWAFEIARGEFLAYWDDDDFFSPTRLEKQASAMIREEADAVGFPIDVIASTAPARFWRWKPATLEGWAKSAAEDKPIGSSVPFHDGSAMFRRSLLEGVPESIREGWQLGFLDEVRKRGARLVAIPNRGEFVYVRHGGNAWRFKTEDKCIPISRPESVPLNQVEFWNDPRPSEQAVAALNARSKDHNGL